MSTDISPAVSVIIPCYNLGAYLDEAVQSVLDQTVQDFEIVIVNDGSTDADTNRLLADYRRPKTRVVHSENRGLGPARNLAIAHARGRYLCALDADDKLAPDFLEKTAAILDRDPSVAFVSCWLRTFGAEDWIWKQDRCDLRTLLGECTVATPSLVRTAAVHAVGGYDERMPVQGYEDWDLWISLVEQGFPGVIIPEVLFYYRRRPGSMSDLCCRGEAHLTLMQYLVSKHRASYQEHVLEVLIQKEAVSCDLLKTTYALDHEIEGTLLPTVQRRREELDRLQRRLRTLEEATRPHETLTALEHQVSDTRRELATLTEAIGHARMEAVALRHSLSWRVTAPLRAVYSLLQRTVLSHGAGTGRGEGQAASAAQKPLPVRAPIDRDTQTP